MNKGVGSKVGRCEKEVCRGGGGARLRLLSREGEEDQEEKMQKRN